LQIGSNFWMAWASPSTEGDMPKVSNTKLIWVYACLSLGSSLFIGVRSILICLSGIFIAQKYFLGMIQCIFRAPMSFFDSTPTGRILNRVCMPIPLISFVPILFKTSSIVKCYKILSNCYGLLIFLHALAFGTKCRENRLLLEDRLYHE
jgi:ABC-type multidrug transport system fused ATPase/permease subunit